MPYIREINTIPAIGMATGTMTEGNNKGVQSIIRMATGKMTEGNNDRREQ